MKDWKNSYHINTFTGATNDEIISFIASLLEKQEQEIKEKIKEFIDGESTWYFSEEAEAQCIKVEDLRSFINKL